MAKSKVEISKVNIKIGDKEIELSLAEAKELGEILNETFGAKLEIQPAPIINLPYIQPYVYPRPMWQYWTTTVTSQADSSVFTLSNSMSADQSSLEVT